MCRFWPLPVFSPFTELTLMIRDRGFATVRTVRERIFARGSAAMATGVRAWERSETRGTTGNRQLRATR